MEVTAEKTFIIKMTETEVQKLLDALNEIDGDSIPEWADKVIDEFYKPLKELMAK